MPVLDQPAARTSLTDTITFVERELAAGRVTALIPELLDQVRAEFDHRGSIRRWTGTEPTPEFRAALRAELLSTAADALATAAALDAHHIPTTTQQGAPL